MKIIKKIKNLFSRKKIQDAPITKLGIKHRIDKGKSNHYMATIAIVYKGKAIRQFKATTKGNSSTHAAQLIEKDMSVRVLEVKKMK